MVWLSRLLSEIMQGEINHDNPNGVRVAGFQTDPISSSAWHCVSEGIYPSLVSQGSVVAENCKYPDKDIWPKIA